MTKTPEDLLLAACEKAEAALDNLAKVAGKVARTRTHVVEDAGPPAYVTSLPDLLRAKLSLSETALGAAVKQLYDVAMPTPLALAGAVSVGPKLSTPLAQAPTAQPARPVGRLSKNSEEPGAGAVLVAPPIAAVNGSIRTRGDTGAGFIGAGDDPKAPIQSL